MFTVKFLTKATKLKIKNCHNKEIDTIKFEFCLRHVIATVKPTSCLESHDDDESVNNDSLMIHKLDFKSLMNVLIKAHFSLLLPQQNGKSRDLKSFWIFLNFHKICVFI